MSLTKSYTRINWENYPSTETPLNESNLNKMDYSLNEQDNRIISMDVTKFDVSDANTLIKDISLDSTTGIFTFTRVNGTTFTIDTKLEKLAINFSYDSATNELVIKLDDGTDVKVDLSALIDVIEFENSSHITMTLQANGKFKADLIKNSITGDYLQPNYLADITVQAQTSQQASSDAQQAKTDAEQAKTDAESARDLAEQYKNQAQSIVNIGIATTTQTGLVKPDGTTITVDTDGTIHGTATTPKATGTSLGIVKPDNDTILINEQGTIRVNKTVATSSELGFVKVDGTTITVDASGNISAVQQEADDVTYDNTTSGLTATDVQDAIDEVNTALGTKLDATDYKKTVSSVNGTNIHITDSVESNMVLNDAVVNLLPNNATTHTMNGVTFTVNSDGSVTANGTASDWADIIRCEKLLKKGTYCYSGSLSENYYLVVRKSSDYSILLNLGETVFTLDTDTTCKLMVYVKIGQTVNNETLYPMLEKGTVAHSYVPPMYDITSCGKNLIKNNFTVGSKSGITCTLNSDKTYTISGNASATTGNNFYVDISGLKSTNSYIISGCPSGGSDTTYRLRVFGGLQGSSGMASDLGSGTTVTGYDSYRLAIQIIQTGVDINLVFKPMLRLASDTDDTYEPYQSSKVTVSSDTVFPLNGLKSFNGITNVFNDYNADMEVVYANDNVGASVLDNAWKLECDNAQNLLPNNATTQTVNGVTFTVNNNGSVTISGTATADTSINYNNTIKLPIGTYIMSGCNGGGYDTYRFYWVVSNGSTTVADNVQLNLPIIYTVTNESHIHDFGTWIKSGATVNTTIYPMLEVGTVAHSYKPYKESYVTNGNVKSLTDTTVNMLNPTLESTAKSGVTITKNNDNTYTLNGTASADDSFLLDSSINLVTRENSLFLGLNNIGISGNVYLSISYTDGNIHLRNVTSDFKGVIPKGKTISHFWIWFEAGTTFTNAIIKPMLTTNLNATYDDYVPYTGDTGKLNSDVAEIYEKLNNYEMKTVQCNSAYFDNKQIYLQKIGNLVIGSIGLETKTTIPVGDIELCTLPFVCKTGFEFALTSLYQPNVRVSCWVKQSGEVMLQVSNAQLLAEYSYIRGQFVYVTE